MLLARETKKQETTQPTDPRTVLIVVFASPVSKSFFQIISKIIIKNGAMAMASMFFKVLNFFQRNHKRHNFFLTSSCHRVLGYLTNEIQRPGYICLSLAQISIAINLNERTIRRCIKSLIDQEMLIKSPGEYHKNTYALHPSFVELINESYSHGQSSCGQNVRVIGTKCPDDEDKMSGSCGQNVRSIIMKDNKDNKSNSSREVSTYTPRATHSPSAPLSPDCNNSKQPPKPTPPSLEDQNMRKAMTDKSACRTMQNNLPPSPSEKVSIEQFKPTLKHLDLANARKLTQEQRSKLLAKFKAHIPYRFLDQQKLNEKFSQWIESERVEEGKSSYPKIPQIKSAAYRDYKSELPEVTEEERAYGREQISNILASLRGKSNQNQGARL